MSIRKYYGSVCYAARFATRKEAEQFIEDTADHINNFGFVSFKEVHEKLDDWHGDYNQYKYGWDDIDGFTVVTEMYPSKHYRVLLPRAVWIYRLDEVRANKSDILKTYAALQELRTSMVYGSKDKKDPIEVHIKAESLSKQTRAVAHGLIRDLKKEYDVKVFVD